MKAVDIKPEHLSKILDIYCKICMPGCSPDDLCVSADRIYENLRAAVLKNDMWPIHEGYRIGSEWTGHSKLKFDIVDGNLIAIFYPNIGRDKNTAAETKKMESARKKFSEDVQKYLDGVKHEISTA